jgi:hypothetical protein
MSGEGKGSGLPDLQERVIEAFRSAYPEVPDAKLEHMARNFVQIIRGIISIGEASGGEGAVSHIEMVNGLVYSCIASAFMDDAEECVIDEAVASKMDECVAKVADWLIGLEILRDNPELYESFVRGAVELGAADWETNRGKLSY